MMIFFIIWNDLYPYLQKPVTMNQQSAILTIIPNTPKTHHASFPSQSASLFLVLLFHCYHNQLQSLQQMSAVRDFLKRLWQGRQVVVDYWKKSPSTKIILINGGLYCMWKLKFIPEDFLVKHFSAERFNLQGGRLHTLITYSFSHMGIFSLFFDMLMVGLMGRAIQSAYGNKYIYWLYGLGALFGGISTSVFKGPSPYVQPHVGADSVIAAYLTFLGLLNPHQTFMLFFFPVRAWVLLLFMGSYSLFFDPQKRIFSGMTAGMTVYQMMRVGFL